MSNDLIVKSNVVITASYHLTANEQRLILSAISQIPKGVEVQDEEVYTVEVSDFIEMGVHPKTAYREMREAAERLYAKIEDCRIPTDEIPKCPVCGGDMEPWVRSFVFLEGRKYHEEYDKWTRFLQAYKNKKILFLELGVGRMTPMFIQEPFWNMTYSWRKSYYVTINPKDAILPKELQDRGMAIHEDIALVLRDAVSLLERR